MRTRSRRPGTWPRPRPTFPNRSDCVSCRTRASSGTHRAAGSARTGGRYRRPSRRELHRGGAASELPRGEGRNAVEAARLGNAKAKVMVRRPGARKVLNRLRWPIARQIGRGHSEEQQRRAPRSVRMYAIRNETRSAAPGRGAHHQYRMTQHFKGGVAGLGAERKNARRYLAA